MINFSIRYICIEVQPFYMYRSENIDKLLLYDLVHHQSTLGFYEIRSVDVYLLAVSFVDLYLLSVSLCISEVLSSDAQNKIVF